METGSLGIMVRMLRRTTSVKRPTAFGYKKTQPLLQGMWLLAKSVQRYFNSGGIISKVWRWWDTSPGSFSKYHQAHLAWIWAQDLFSEMDTWHVLLLVWCSWSWYLQNSWFPNHLCLSCLGIPSPNRRTYNHNTNKHNIFMALKIALKDVSYWSTLIRW